MPPYLSMESSSFAFHIRSFMLSETLDTDFTKSHCSRSRPNLQSSYAHRFCISDATSDFKALWHPPFFSSRKAVKFSGHGSGNHSYIVTIKLTHRDVKWNI